VIDDTRFEKLLDALSAYCGDENDEDGEMPQISTNIPKRNSKDERVEERIEFLVSNGFVDSLEVPLSDDKCFII